MSRRDDLDALDSLWAHGPSPAAQLREHLTQRRAEGWSFRLAFEVAMAEIHWPSRTSDRREWKGILREHEGAWRAAYCGDAPPDDFDLQPFSAIHRLLMEADADDPGERPVAAALA